MEGSARRRQPSQSPTTGRGTCAADMWADRTRLTAACPAALLDKGGALPPRCRQRPPRRPPRLALAARPPARHKSRQRAGCRGNEDANLGGENVGGGDMVGDTAMLLISACCCHQGDPQLQAVLYGCGCGCWCDVKVSLVKYGQAGTTLPIMVPFSWECGRTNKHAN